MTQTKPTPAGFEKLKLTPEEASDLQQCEDEIERGLDAVLAVGAALQRIQTAKLYKQDYATFEQYCLQRWGLSRSYAYGLIDYVKVTDDIRDAGLAPPANEGQARPLAKLKDADQRVEAWESALESSGGKPTARHVTDAVKRITGEADRSETSGAVDSRPAPKRGFADYLAELERAEVYVRDTCRLESIAEKLQQVIDELRAHQPSNGAAVAERRARNGKLGSFRGGNNGVDRGDVPE